MLENPSIKFDQVLMSFRKAFRYDLDDMTDIELQECTARADRNHVAHDAVTARVVFNTHLFDGFANNAVVGQFEDMNICSGYGASVDLRRGVDYHYAIWNNAM